MSRSLSSPLHRFNRHTIHFVLKSLIAISDVRDFAFVRIQLHSHTHTHSHTPNLGPNSQLDLNPLAASWRLLRFCVLEGSKRGCPAVGPSVGLSVGP